MACNRRDLFGVLSTITIKSKVVVLEVQGEVEAQISSWIKGVDKCRSRCEGRLRDEDENINDDRKE